MCDCASENDSEPKIQLRPIENNKLQSDPRKSCDCTSDDDSGAKIEICNDKVAVKDGEANASESCDCTSESSVAATKSCDCTSESSVAAATKSCDCTSKESSEQKIEISADADNQDHSKAPFAIVQVELSESMLNLLPSSESSTSCDCTSPRGSSQDLPTCSSKSEASCDCTSDSSDSISSDTSTKKEKKMEWTLAIIKPEALMFRSEIERIIEDEGFAICQRRWLHLTAEQASEFYRDNYEQKDFARLVAYMSSKPIAVYVLCKLDAIAEWRMLIGPSKVSEARLYAPDSIRGRFGRKGEDMKNAVHGSIDEKAAEREIHFFFPDCILEPLLQGEAAEKYLRKKINDVLSVGLVKCCEEKPEDPLLWLGNWLLDSRRPKYL